MKIEDLKEGLEILIAHGHKGYNLAAEHDVIYIHDADKFKMPLSVHRKLKKLGFNLSAGDQHWYIFT